MWGGRTEDFSIKSTLSSTLHVFNPKLESWESKSITGSPPPGLYGGACSSAGHCLYLFGGSNGPDLYSSLHQLDTKTSTWARLGSDGPMRKIGCGMVTYANKLLLFGGYGYPCGATQSGAEFVKNSRFSDGRGWSNELHAFDLKEGEEMWSGML